MFAKGMKWTARVNADSLSRGTAINFFRQLAQFLRELMKCLGAFPPDGGHDFVVHLPDEALHFRLRLQLPAAHVFVKRRHKRPGNQSSFSIPGPLAATAHPST